MTSIRIHEDQENQEPRAVLRQKQNTMAGQQRRIALGVIDENQMRDRNTRKGKLRQRQGPAPLLPQPQNIPSCSNDKENDGDKRLAIPVAQFEAFKVYEDNMKITGGHPVMPDVEEFYSRSNALVTKRDLMIMTFGHDKKSLTAKEYHEIINRRPFDVSSDSLSGEIDEPEQEQEVVSSDESVMNMSIVESGLQSPQKESRKPDESDRERFFHVDEYLNDIYLYIRGHEMKHRPKPGYMKKQPDITYQMRSVLVDWLVEVATEYNMSTETWYLAVNYIDRFLSYMSVVRAKLQLVGTAAMFIAGKYEEIFPPNVKKYVYITADTYCQKQILRMEQLILKVLNFDLSVPTPYSFLRCICAMIEVPELIKHLASFLCDMSVLETDPYIEFLPSQLASSALALARHTLDMEMWPKEYESATGYILEDLHQGIEFLSLVHNKAATHQQRAIPEKYAHDDWNFVSELNAKPIVKFSKDCSTM